MSETVRFSQLVSSSGKPELHTLWGPPEADREFQRAVKAARVLTIHQENVGSKKDFGIVGFSTDGPAQYLVFPKPLKAYNGRRVVGIKYEAFDPPAPPRAKTVAKPEPTKKEKAKESKRARLAKEVSPRPPVAPKVEEPQEPPTNSEPPELPAHSKHEAPAEDVASPEHQAEPKQKKVAFSKRVSTQTPQNPEKPSLDRAAVVKELRGAMKELEAGKAVLVFRRLEKLVSRIEGKT